MDNVELNKDIKFGVKSFISICIILLAVILFVGILTYVIPSGEYKTDADGNIIVDSFEFIESDTRLPFYRWLTAPFEAIVLGEGNGTVFQIIAIIIILGGSFKVLDKSGVLYSALQIILHKFHNRKYLLIWVITLIMMLLASCFGLQEELMILFPLFLSFSRAMKWSNFQAIGLILITTGVGFTTALFNPFTVGVASELSGISIIDGFWYRLLIFAILYVATSLYLVHMAKGDEKRNAQLEADGEIKLPGETELGFHLHKTKMGAILFGVALLIIVISSAIPFIADLGIGMILMALAFVVGSFIIGKLSIGSVKKTALAFLEGAKDLSPSIVIIILAFTVKYVAECGNILHTIFYYCHRYMSTQSPYVAVILLYLLVLVLEFLIPGSVAKAMLIIPLLTLAPLPGISTNIIVLAYLFGDGYTNVLYPTCSTLVVGLGIANVSYIQWLKKTFLFQIILAVSSILFLLLAVRIGL